MTEAEQRTGWKFTPEGLMRTTDGGKTFHRQPEMSEARKNEVDDFIKRTPLHQA